MDRSRKHFYEKIKNQHNNCDLKKSNLKNHDITEVAEYFETVLLRDEFTLDIWYEKIYFVNAAIEDYKIKSGEITYKYRIPNSEEICVIECFSYDKKNERIASNDLNKSNAKARILSVARAILFRSISMIFESDAYQCINVINLTGYLNYFDSALGTWQNVNVIKLRINKDDYLKIVPENADIDELFMRVLECKESAGLYDKQPYELNEVNLNKKNRSVKA